MARRRWCFSDQLRPRELLPLVPPRPPDERPLDPRLPVPDVLLELPDALREPVDPPDALRELPDAPRLVPPVAPAPRLLPDALRELLELLEPALRELPEAERPPLEPPLVPALAPRLRVRSSTSPVSALSAACVESSDVIPRPIVRLRPVDPEPLLVLPLAFVPPLRFEAMHTSR
jgi:hypothetical protein